MAKSNGLKPGTSTGESGGIFQEVGPRGRPVPNHVTVPDHRPLPPTTRPGHTWKPIQVTPPNKR
jgi:hypothetical protein